MPTDDDKRIDPSEIDPPPKAPRVGRGVDLPLPHIIGVALPAAVVALAAFGFFGESRSSTRASSGSVEIAADYPSRFRYKQIEAIRVVVTNRSFRTIDTLTMAFDSTFMAGFSGISFIPPLSEPWEVQLTGLEPGESRRIEGQLQAEEYGRHAGTISASGAGLDTTRADVATLIFP